MTHYLFLKILLTKCWKVLRRICPLYIFKTIKTIVIWRSCCSCIAIISFSCFTILDESKKYQLLSQIGLAEAYVALIRCYCHFRSLRCQTEHHTRDQRRFHPNNQVYLERDTSHAFCSCLQVDFKLWLVNKLANFRKNAMRTAIFWPKWLPLVCLC